MQQSALPYKYEAEKNESGLTALGGLPVYLDLASVAGLRGALTKHLGVRLGTQGWDDSQMVTALILLNLAGGECVEDMETIEVRIPVISDTDSGGKPDTHSSRSRTPIPVIPKFRGQYTKLS